MSIVKTQTSNSAKKFLSPKSTNLNDILFLFISVFVKCQDTNLNISEKVFESEFNKLYGSAQDEAKAAAALADAEKQVFNILNKI